MLAHSVSLLLAIALIIAQLQCTIADESNNWPQFRGPNSDGISKGANLPKIWDSTKNVSWKVDISGRGWSSPVVWEDRIFLTTVVRSEKGEEPKKGLYFGGDRPQPPEDVHQWRIVCLDLDTGDVLWDYLAYQASPKTSIHLKNSFASETPVVDDERVYAYFGNLGIFCLSHEGDLLWEKTIEPHKMRNGWGTASSPALHNGVLYIVNDNQESSYFTAIDSESGNEIWKIPRDEKSNWATPFVWQHDQRTELITSGKLIRSYDLSGNLLWQLGDNSSIIIPTPLAAHGLLYVSSGYVLDSHKPVYAINPGASGDISLTKDQTSNDSIRWSQSKAGPYNTSPLVYQDLLYVLHDRGFLACYNALTGELLYDKKRLPEGRAFTASPWAYNGQVFCLSEYGITYAIKSGPDFEILHTNKLHENAMCMSTPAIAGNSLIIRAENSLYCIQEK